MIGVRSTRRGWAAALMDGVDWTTTPLGPEEGWPQSLRTSLGIAFESRFPIIIFWGPEFVQLYNEAYSGILGTKHPKAFGQRARDCFPEIWEQIEPMLSGVLERGESTWSEDLMLPLERSGVPEECYFTFSYSPITDERGICGVFCAVTETTAKVLREREARERVEALAELDRAKTDFFNNVSHEFRTPLTLILGPLDDALARERALDRDELAMLRRNARRLLRLVNTLLDFSRIDANRLALDRRPVDLAALTAEVASTFRSAFESAGIAFEIDAPALDGPVSADPRLWEHVVLNLLSNAFKFTFQGTVRVSLRRAGDVVRLEVADQGAGMSESERVRAFERFWRGSGRPARTHEGSGIGLALVAEIASLHGGTAKLESAEGRGTTAIVEIPYVPAKADGIAALPSVASELTLAETAVWSDGRPQPNVDPGPAGRPTILLVEDNADLREYLTRLLTPGYRVEIAADGAEAKAKAVQSPPDLILSDVMMPGMDGIELVRALRAERATRGVPIVLLSARADDRSASEGIKAGADDYLVKPFASEELLGRLERHIARAQIRAEEAARFRQLADEIPQIILTLGARGEPEWINKRWFDFTGLSRAAVGDLRFDGVVHPDDLARLRAVHRERIEAGDAFEAEVRLKPLAGSDDAYRWHLARLVPIRSEPEGAIARWIGTATDVHERRLSAEERERDLRILAEAIPQMVWRADPAGRNDYFNNRWYEYTGQSPEEARADAFSAVHPDDRDVAVARWRESVAAGEPYTAEFRMRSADGSYRWFVARGVPQRDEAGAIVRWFGTTTDIDELKRTQQALVRSEHGYRTLIETTTEGMLVLDAQDRTTFVNARMAEMLGYEPAELIGKSAFEFSGQADQDDAHRLKARILAEGQCDAEVRLMRRDGSEFWAYVSTSVVRDASGAFAGILGMFHDITERRRAETRQHVIAEASSALAQSLGLRETLDKLLGVVVPNLAGWAIVDLKSEDERNGREPARTAAVLHRDPATAADALSLLGRSYLRTGVADEACRTSRPSIDGAWVRTFVRDEWQALFARLGTGSSAVVPLQLKGRTFGWMTFVATDRIYDDGDRALFAEIAARAAVAIDHARLYDRERRVAVTLQDAALPKKLPNVPGLTFSAVYQAARSEALVGGDWYDAFRLSDGRIVLSIGDVMGSGLDAAVTMGAVRQAIRGAAQIYPEPTGVLDAADRALRSEQPERIVTAFVGLLDPLTLTFTYASAGHPPPLLRAEDGTIVELDGSGPPLGLRDPNRLHERSRALTLTDRSLLVLYTDGLTESTRDIFEGERRLREALNDRAVLEACETAGALRDALLDNAQDDVAILTVRFDDVRRRVTGAGDDASGAHWTFDAKDALTARFVRGAIAQTLRRHGARDEDVRNAELLFSELVGNVVRHADGDVEVALDVTGTQPVLHVLDRGAGFTFRTRLPNDPLSESGRGLYIVATLASELSVLPRKDGGSHARAVLSFETREPRELAGAAV